MPKDKKPTPKTDKDIARDKQRREQAMDMGQEAGMKAHKKNRLKGYAKGGKVRGCGIARKGLGKGARGR